MKRLIIYASLLFTGMVSGWWLRDIAPHNSPHDPQRPVTFSNTHGINPSTSNPPTTSMTKGTTASPLPGTTRQPDSTRFEQLLNERAFEQAIAYYEEALKIDDGYQAILKPSLENYLGASLKQCANGAFVELVDLWLDTYYEDIPVLLLLAENQRLCSSPEEAARTLQIARTYAVQPGAQDSVSAAVTGLITATDDNLSRQKNWIALLGFYDFLQTVDLATNASQLRRAALYQLLGEHRRSQDLLSELREKNDGLDPQWTAALELQWRNSTTPSSVDKTPAAQGIPLTRQGDHFLVSATINDANRVVLMIDTGASVTSLARSSFTKIDSAGFGYHGSRLFNTANGMTQGDVYQTGSITLGNTRLDSPEIAVLDYASSSGIDGLLGMNVLRNYRFEIDQDEAILYLYPRQ